MSMDQFCESCHLRPSTKLVYFDDDGPTFAVCSPCANAAEGHYGRVLSLPGGGDAA